jgi:hypothetical protein
MSETRKLVVILVADVVEYNRPGPCRPVEKYVEYRFQGGDTRIPLLFAVALGAAAFSAIPAIATDEGTVAAKITSTDTPLKIIPVGKSGDRVFVEEEQGTIERDGDTHPWRCVWTTLEDQSYAFDARGYCIETDQQGDQIVFKTTSKGSGGAGNDAEEVTTGTGKFAGITGKITFTCQFAGGINYTASCDAQVNYKMPRLSISPRPTTFPLASRTRRSLITQDDYSKDLLKALADLKKNSFVDPDRIHPLGWSYGAGAALNALPWLRNSPT